MVLDAFKTVDMVQGIITSDYYCLWAAEVIAIDE